MQANIVSLIFCCLLFENPVWLGLTPDQKASQFTLRFGSDYRYFSGWRRSAKNGHAWESGMRPFLFISLFFADR